MATMHALKKRMERLESAHGLGHEFEISEIYLVGVQPATEDRPIQRDPRVLFWRNPDIYEQTFSHHGGGDCDIGYELFKEAAGVELPDTWQEYANNIHAETIELFSQFRYPPSH